MKINTRVDINSLGVFSDDGKKRLIVDRYKLTVSDIDLKPIEEKLVKKVEDGDFYYGENEDGFISFSFDSNRKKTGHGGHWSSNPEAIYENLGIWTVEVVHGNRACHMRPERVVKFLSDEYALILIDRDNTYGGSGFHVIRRTDLLRVGKICLIKHYVDISRMVCVFEKEDV